MVTPGESLTPASTVVEVGSMKVQPARSTVTIKPFGLKGGTAKIMDVVHVGGTVKPYKNGQRVRVYYYNDGVSSERYIGSTIWTP